jgi:hypothetical protein
MMVDGHFCRVAPRQGFIAADYSLVTFHSAYVGELYLELTELCPQLVERFTELAGRFL